MQDFEVGWDQIEHDPFIWDGLGGCLRGGRGIFDLAVYREDYGLVQKGG